METSAEIQKQKQGRLTQIMYKFFTGSCQKGNSKRFDLKTKKKPVINLKLDLNLVRNVSLNVNNTKPFSTVYLMFSSPVLSSFILYLLIHCRKVTSRSVITSIIGPFVLHIRVKSQSSPSSYVHQYVDTELKHCPKNPPKMYQIVSKINPIIYLSAAFLNFQIKLFYHIRFSSILKF